MNKITYIKNVRYYNKKNEPIDVITSEKKTFDNLAEAIELMKATKLHYVDNPKGTSVYESIIIWDKSDYTNWYSYTKDINVKTKDIVQNLGENRGERV